MNINIVSVIEIVVYWHGSIGVGISVVWLDKRVVSRNEVGFGFCEP